MMSSSSTSSSSSKPLVVTFESSFSSKFDVESFFASPSISCKHAETTASVSCFDDCDAAKDELAIDISFEFTDVIYYDLTNIECFLYGIFKPFLINYMFSSFDTCDIFISVKGGHSDGYCKEPPCLFIYNSNRRLLLNLNNTISIEFITNNQNQAISFETYVEMVENTGEPHQTVSVTETPVFVISLLLAIGVLFLVSFYFGCGLCGDEPGCQSLKSVKPGRIGKVIEGLQYDKCMLMQIITFASIGFDVADCVFDFMRE
eukprot:409410_1